MSPAAADGGPLNRSEPINRTVRTVITATGAPGSGRGVAVRFYNVKDRAAVAVRPRLTDCTLRLRQKRSCV